MVFTPSYRASALTLLAGAAASRGLGHSSLSLTISICPVSLDIPESDWHVIFNFIQRGTSFDGRIPHTDIHVLLKQEDMDATTQNNILCHLLSPCTHPDPHLLPYLKFWRRVPMELAKVRSV